MKAIESHLPSEGIGVEVLRPEGSVTSLKAMESHLPSGGVEGGGAQATGSVTSVKAGDLTCGMPLCPAGVSPGPTTWPST